MEGNLAQRRHAKFVPGGVAKTFIPTKDAELKNDYDEWLARVVCFAFSISPQPFVEHMNRATADTAHATALSEGLAPIQSWIKQLVDYVIVTEFAAPDLEFQWRDDSAPDPAVAANVAHTYVANGIKSVNEVRAEIGLDPVAGGDTPMVLTTTGPVPLTALGGRGGRPSLATKAGFDPDQPRDDRGRWTGGGGGGGDASGGGDDSGGDSGDASDGSEADLGGDDGADGNDDSSDIGGAGG